MHHSRAKHKDIKHYFIRVHVENEDFVLEFVNSQNKLADIFTKPLVEFVDYENLHYFTLSCFYLFLFVFGVLFFFILPKGDNFPPQYLNRGTKIKIQHIPKAFKAGSHIYGGSSHTVISQGSIIVSPHCIKNCELVVLIKTGENVSFLMLCKI